MTPAAALQNKIRLAVSQIGGRLFCVTVGIFWTGKMVREFTAAEVVKISVKPGDKLIRNARIVNVGVKGMSDLAGWMPVVVTPDMVGKTVATRLDIEVKTTDELTPEQENWIEAANKSGGRAGVARSPEEAVRIALGS